MRMNSQHLKHSKGFTYIGLMLIVAIAGIALSGVGIVWKTEMQRENEKELRFAGEQYVAAIASYYECKVCGPNQLPKNLKDLLKDSRTPTVVHHIRKLYRDPMTRGNDWGLIKNGDRIMGVYSKSKLEPLAKPQDADLLKKKIATQSGNSVSGNKSNTNQTNLNQVNTNQSGVNQVVGNNSNNNSTGINVEELYKSDTSKTNQAIKPKKPSYQDWQFVYGGAVEQAPKPLPTKLNANNLTEKSNNNGNAPLSPEVTQLDSDADSWAANQGERTQQLCTEPYLAAQKACLDLCGSGVVTNECRVCKADSQSAYNLCNKSIQ
jgi:type II secretory pathway pseudopilin PulG